MTITVEQLKEMVREVNGWDGSLEGFEYIEMEELDSFLGHIEPLEILRMAHFGNFEWNDDYFNINVYGNLDSYSENHFHGLIIDNKDEIIERFNELVEEGAVEPLE